MSNEEIEKILKLGAYHLFLENDDDEKKDQEFQKADIDTILKKSSTIIVSQDQSSKKSTSKDDTKINISSAYFSADKEDSKVDLTDNQFWEKLLPDFDDVASLKKTYETDNDALYVEESATKFFNYLQRVVTKILPGFLMKDPADVAAGEELWPIVSAFTKNTKGFSFTEKQLEEGKKWLSLLTTPRQKMKNMLKQTQKPEKTENYSQESQDVDDEEYELEDEYKPENTESSSEDEEDSDEVMEDISDLISSGNLCKKLDFKVKDKNKQKKRSIKRKLLYLDNISVNENSNDLPTTLQQRFLHEFNLLTPSNPTTSYTTAPSTHQVAPQLMVRNIINNPSRPENYNITSPFYQNRVQTQNSNVHNYIPQFAYFTGGQQTNITAPASQFPRTIPTQSFPTQNTMLHSIRSQLHQNTHWQWPINTQSTNYANLQGYRPYTSAFGSGSKTPVPNTRWFNLTPNDPLFRVHQNTSRNHENQSQRNFSILSQPIVQQLQANLQRSHASNASTQNAFIHKN